MYAHFLFEAFDTNKNGSVSFEVSSNFTLASLNEMKANTFFYDTSICIHRNIYYIPKYLLTEETFDFISCLGTKVFPKLCFFLFQDFVFGLSIILRGTVNDRLNWAFNLYDLNKDGCITKEVKHWHR